MMLAFDVENVVVTEFGLGRNDGNNQSFNAIPVHAKVQTALREMVQMTWESMQNGDQDGPVRYQPSEKYSGTDTVHDKTMSGRGYEAIWAT